VIGAKTGIARALRAGGLQALSHTDNSLHYQWRNE